MTKTIYRIRREELKKQNPSEWSQIAVAIKCGVSLSTYQLWEKGVTQPTPENLRKLNEVLGIT